MTKTKALKEARSESSIYRQGPGWIFSHYDTSVRCKRVTGEMPYGVARASRTSWCADRARVLQGKQPQYWSRDAVGHRETQKGNA